MFPPCRSPRLTSGTPGISSMRVEILSMTRQGNSSRDICTPSPHGLKPTRPAGNPNLTRWRRREAPCDPRPPLRPPQAGAEGGLGRPDSNVLLEILPENSHYVGTIFSGMRSRSQRRTCGLREGDVRREYCRSSAFAIYTKILIQRTNTTTIVGSGNRDLSICRAGSPGT